MWHTLKFSVAFLAQNYYSYDCSNFDILALVSFNGSYNNRVLQLSVVSACSI